MASRETMRMTPNLRTRLCLVPMIVRPAILSAAVGIMLALAACAHLGRSSGTQPPSDLATVIAEATTVGGLPGMAVLEVRNGRVAWELVGGVREIGTQDAIRVGDRWHLGSNGKPMTATLIARLVERGRLSWNDRLDELLPELAPVLHPGFREVTLLDLVSHRSGLAANTDASFVAAFDHDSRPLPDQRLAYLRRALNEPPAAPRGTYHYSNTGFVAAGAAAERATGRTFEDLLRGEVFQPLQMKSAGFGPTSRGQPLGHADGVAVTPPRGDNPLMWAPAGGMHMSLGDWAKFAIDQMKGRRGEGKLLQAGAYRFLHTSRDGTGPAIDWGVDNKPYGSLLIHTGSNGVWYAVTALAPDLLNGVVVATNAEAGGASASDRALEVVTVRWANGAR